MNYINILHLSDVHLKPEATVQGYNQSVVLEALVASVAQLADSAEKPDILIFSGDLVNAADDNIFDDIKTIIERLALAAGLDNDRTIICFGNHDASRNAIGPAIPLIQDFRSQAKTADGANELCLEPRFNRHVGNVFGSIATLNRTFGKTNEVSQNFLTSSYRLDRIGLGVVTVNSSSLSGAGLTPDLSDERNLFIPEMFLDKALKGLPDHLTKIVIGHHPLSFLNKQNEITIKTLIQKKAIAYLSGHMHRAMPEFISSPQGETAYIQSGALYAGRDWWNGYGLISIDPDAPHFPRVLYKKWHKERREFGIASDLSDDGFVFTSDDARRHWSRIKPRLSDSIWENWRLESLTDFILQECNKDVSGVFSEARFIEPEFEKDRYVTTSDGIEKAAVPELEKFDHLIGGTDNLVIFSPAESGKTTLLREWASRVAAKSASSLSWQIPVVINYGDMKRYPAAIETLVRRRLPDLPSGSDYKDLLENGKILFLVDDVHLSTLRDAGGFGEFIKRFPKNRYILLTSSIYLQGAGIAPIIVEGVSFSHIRSKQLKTSQLLALIESHGTTDPTQADRLLQRMMVEASSLNVPITPVTGSFLIQIYTEDNSTSLVNKANLLERYIEISLEKFAPAELLPSSFDFRNKTDLLSFVAERMSRQELYKATDASFVSWINEYLAEYGLRFSALSLIDYFVQARVLEIDDGYIAFRLTAFFEYFVAVRMSEDDDFKTYVLSEDNYLRYPNEISFYAAISRKDVGWLNELVDRFVKNSELSHRGRTPVNAAEALENFVLPSSTADSTILRTIEDRSFNSSMTEEERRQALDDDLPALAVADKPSVRPADPVVGQRWIAQLTMLSSTLKNMELITSTRKSQVLSIVLEAWLEFISMSMQIVPTLVEQRRLKFAGVEYIVVFPDDMDPGELAQRLYMYMPISTAKVVNFHLGTEKLRVQLEAGLGSSTGESAASQFLRGAILAQLGVEGLPAILATVAKAISGKRYLQEVFFRLLAEVVVRYRLPEKERQKLKALAADVRIELEGVTGTDAARRKGSVMRALDTSRLKVQLLLK